jgi:mxaJ protein
MKGTILIATLLLAGCKAAAPAVLTVCADPNNMPFSNRAEQGFENRIARMIADGLHRQLRYVWWAQRRGFVRNTLGADKCDIWPGVAAGLERAATTRPYYRSSYMFVTRQSASLAGLTLDDPRLRRLKIGVQMVGADGMNTPPAQAVAQRGLIANVRGYMLYGDYGRPNPPTAILDAVAHSGIDVGLVWGPPAGWYALHAAVPLRLEPVTPWLDDAQWPMVFDISVGVRKDQPDLRKNIDGLLARRSGQIRSILASYGIPVVD